ncbi:3-oxoacyl-[acyl-carrier-protein] reductase FabG [Streptomyces sp. S4.7]|nr:3-oxoacyl-[acyl-carrier-protein] reductase FabG [Streptomyces sp. S4.7]
MCRTTGPSPGARIPTAPKASRRACAKPSGIPAPKSCTGPAISPTPKARPGSSRRRARRSAAWSTSWWPTTPLDGSDGSLKEIDAELLDAHWATNTRSVILLIQAYAKLRAAHPVRIRRGSRIMMMTSGQDLRAGMPEEIAYSLSKGALASATHTLAASLGGMGITVNTVNPGPVDTDYLTGEAYDKIAGMFPAGRWGMPDDPARLIAWLATDEAEWITGQVINSEGGFLLSGEHFTPVPGGPWPHERPADPRPAPADEPGRQALSGGSSGARDAWHGTSAP